MSRELTFDNLETSFCQSTSSPSGEASPYTQIKAGIDPLICWIETLGSVSVGAWACIRGGEKRRW